MMWVFRTPASRLVRQASTLGIIPLSITPLGDQVVAFRRGQTPDQAVRFVLVGKDAGGVGEKDQLFGLKRLGDGGRGGVGVDVQEPALRRPGLRPAREAPARRPPGRGFRSGGTSTALTSPTRPRSIGPSGPFSSQSFRPKRH